MSWGLREYFVFTECLIKEHIISLFDGLTMAYDQNKVVKKILDSASRQGCDGYDIIGPANHLDYQKWIISGKWQPSLCFEWWANFMDCQIFSPGLMKCSRNPGSIIVIGMTWCESVHPASRADFNVSNKTPSTTARKLLKMSRTTTSYCQVSELLKVRLFTNCWALTYIHL